MTDKESLAVEKTLGEPVFVEFSDYTQKIRTQLFFVSSISIAICLYGLKLLDSSSFLGLRFEGFEHSNVTNTLLLLVSYLLIHFVWCAWDNLLEWRLRITGTRVEFVTTGRMSSNEGDYPNNPRQSTLYNWSRDKTSLDKFNKTIKLIEDNIDKIQSAPPAPNHLSTDLSTLASNVRSLKSSIDSLEQSMDGVRMNVSLQRFDNWFQLFLRSQNLRWFVIEFLLPILLAGFAVALLAY